MKKFVFIIFFTLFFHLLFGQTIQMEKSGRTYLVPCNVNGLGLKFILDTGADAVSISLSDALFMLRNGYLKDSDLLNSEFYRLANGDLVEGTTLVLRSIVIGGLTIKNVEATIVHSIDAPMLFGQSALERFGKVTIDYQNNQLIIGENQVVHTNRIVGEWDYYIRGIDKYDRGDLKGAMEDFNKSIERNPRHSKSFYNRGIVKSEFGDILGAIQDFNKTIELDPNDRRVYVNRGVAKGKLQDYRGAIQDFNKEIQLNPESSNAYNNRGTAKKALGDYNGAMADFNKAIELEPDPVCYMSRANLKLVLKDFRGAISDLNRIIELDSRFRDAYYNRGLAKIVLGDDNSGCLDFSKAGELGHPDAYETIREFCK